MLVAWFRELKLI